MGGLAKEKDWTWESESRLQEDAPDLLLEWRTKQSLEQVVHEVEKLLRKRKRNGIPHYRVKWTGYEKGDHVTWEQCERLEVDVPDLVDEFETKSKVKKRH
jgi:hypothetical protein